MRKPSEDKVKSLASRQGCVFVHESSITHLELRELCEKLYIEGFFSEKEKSHNQLKYVYGCKN